MSNQDQNQNFKTRKVEIHDFLEIFNLYKKSAIVKDGLARNLEEITEKFIHEILEKAVNNGLGIVILNQENKIIGSLLSSKFEPRTFCHTLGNMSLAVDPQYFGQKIGKKLFVAFTEEIKENHPEILRVELNVRVVNQRAVKIYEEVGFVLEGIMKNRLLDFDGELSDDSFMAWMNPNFKK